MRKTVIAALIALAVAPAIVGQTAKQIDSIRAEVSLINKSAAKYQKKTKNVEDISLEGTEATYFTSGRGLKKITAKIYGETFRSTAELYLVGEEVIFVYEKLERYDTHIAMDPPPKVAKIIETRVYFAGDKAVRVMEGKIILTNSNPRFSEAAAEMKDLAEKLKGAYVN